MNLSDFDEDLAKKQIEQLTESADILSVSRICTKMNISAQNICLLAEKLATYMCKQNEHHRIGKLLYTCIQLEIILQELEKITQQYHL